MPNVKKQIGNRLLRWGWARSFWTRYRARQLHEHYSARREKYAAEAARMGLVYRETDVAKRVRERIRGRGYGVKPRQLGDIHTFAVIPIYYWHEHLMPDLRELGPVSHFDYIREGFSTSGLLSSGGDGAVNRRLLQERLLGSLERAHRQRPVDWAFFYAGAPEVTPSLMETITTRFGIPTVNMSLDDKQAFEGPKIGECRAAVVDITRCFDLFLTSARVTCEWHLVEGGRPFYLPEGFNPACYRPMPVEQDIDVSFIGVAYGFRVEVVRYLQKHGINIQPFGSGWGTTEVWGDDQVAVINRSRINLGMGGIGYRSV